MDTNYINLEEVVASETTEVSSSVAEAIIVNNNFSDTSDSNMDADENVDNGPIVYMMLTHHVLAMSNNDSISPLPGRIGNHHRDRGYALYRIETMDDMLFRRSFRMNRVDFNALAIIVTPVLQRNTQQAINSSGSAISIDLRLYITLRVLAGASYLDMYWYEVSVNHIMNLVVNTCEAINLVLNNINMPSANDEEGYKTLAAGWKKRLSKKLGSALSQGILDGVVAAGDGLAVAIREPRSSDLDGRPVHIYRNRKGFFALIVQAFCDSYCRFVYFDVG